MSSRLSLGIAGVLLLLLCLVINAPARLLHLLLPGEQVILQGLEGSLWRGQANRALVDVGAGHLHLGRVTWTLRPLSLLLFAPSLDIHSEWGSQLARGQVTLRGASHLALRDFEANASADLARLFAPVALTGMVSAQLDHLVFQDRLPVAGEGRLVWQNGGWQSPQGQMALGTYALDFIQAAGDPLLGEVITLSGPVQAVGTVRVDGLSYGLDLTVGAPQGKLEPQLERALSLLARPVDDGYRVQLDGEL